MNKKTYLVTGGLGFIGSHLVEKLLKKKCSIIVVDDLSSGSKNNLSTTVDHVNLKIIIDKIQDLDCNKFKNIVGIFHLGAQTSVQGSIEKPYESSSNNLLSSIKVFEIAKKLSIPVIYASSSAIYGNLKIGDDSSKNIDLISPYAYDKYSLEIMAKAFFNTYSIKSVGLRFFNVYGPRQDPDSPYSGVISIFSKNLILSKPIKIFGGSQTRDFIYVKDVVNCMLKAMNKANSKKVCEFLNVGSGKEISISNLYKLLNNKIKNTSKIKCMPHMKGDPLFSNGKFKKLLNVLNISNKKFVSLSDGLDETIKYIEKNKNE